MGCTASRRSYPARATSASLSVSPITATSSQSPDFTIPCETQAISTTSAAESLPESIVFSRAHLSAPDSAQSTSSPEDKQNIDDDEEDNVIRSAVKSLQESKTLPAAAFEIPIDPSIRKPARRPPSVATAAAAARARLRLAPVALSNEEIRDRLRDAEAAWSAMPIGIGAVVSNQPTRVKMARKETHEQAQLFPHEDTEVAWMALERNMSPAVLREIIYEREQRIMRNKEREMREKLERLAAHEMHLRDVQRRRKSHIQLASSTNH